MKTKLLLCLALLATAAKASHFFGSAGGGVAIGGAVTDGADNQILFINPAGVLDQDANFKWDTDTQRFTIVNQDIFSLSVDPTAGAGVAANSGSLGLRSAGGAGQAWLKYDTGNTQWAELLTSRNGWALAGNAGTDPLTQYIGTSDETDLVFKTNNIERMRIFSDSSVYIEDINSGVVKSNMGLLHGALLLNADVDSTAAIARSKTASGTAYRLLANNSLGVMSENAAITASRAVVSDVNGQLVASATTATEQGYVSGVTSSIQTQLNAKEPTITTLTTAKGGTGLSSIGTANQVLGVNAGATGLEYKTLTGTANQVTVTQGVGTATFSLPQNIHTGATPTFSRLSLSSAGNSTTPSLTIGGGSDGLFGSGGGNEVSIAADSNLAFTFSANTNENTSYFPLRTTSSVKFEDPGVGTNAITVGSPSGLAASYTLTLPTALPASTQYAKSTSAGVMSFGFPAFTEITGSVAAPQMPALTGDITTSAGAVATTLATVNANVGSFTNATVTVNAKGLVTAASSGTSSVPTLFGTRASARSVVAATGITSGASHMSTTASAQKIYVVGSVAGDSVAATITAGTVDGATMCIQGTSNANTVSLTSATTNVTVAGNVTLGSDDIWCSSWDANTWNETSRSIK